MLLAVTILLVCFSSFLMLALRFMSLVMFSGLCGGGYLIRCHVQRPPIGGSAFSNVMPGVVSPSIIALAALSDVLPYSISVCDLTFPMFVFSVWSLFLLGIGL